MESQIQSLVIGTIQKMESEGKLQMLVEKHVTEAINDTLKDAFGYFGTFKEDLKKYFKENVIFKPESIDLPVYNEYISKALAKAMNEVLGEQAKMLADEAVRKSLGVIPEQKEYSVDEILKQLVKLDLDLASDDVEWDDGPYKRMSLYVEPGERISFIYYDFEEDKEKYQCSGRIVVNANSEIDSVRVDVGGDTSRGSEFLLNLKYSGAKVKWIHKTAEGDYALNVDGLVEYCAC